MSSTSRRRSPGILVATTPIFTALLAIRLDHEERSEGLRLVGVGVGVAGVALLFGFDLGGSSAALLGGLAVVLASVGYSVGSFVVKHRLSDARPLGVVATVMTASALMLLIPAIATAPASAPGLGPIAAVVALGVFGTGVAFVIFYLLIADRRPGADDDRLLPRAGLRGRLRSGAAGRVDQRGDAGRPRPDRRRLVGCGLGDDPGLTGDRPPPAEPARARSSGATR